MATDDRPDDRSDRPDQPGPADPDGTRRWQYHLIGDTSDPDELRARARDGSDVVLVRSVPGTAVEDVLSRAGEWVPSEHLARMRFRGDLEWDVTVTADEAHAVASRWAALGRTDTTGPTDEQIPPDLERRLRDNDELFARRDALREQHRLGDGQLTRARSLLAAPDELAPDWLGARGRVVALVETAMSLHDPAEIGRCHDAFRAAGEDELWAVVPDPDPVSRAMGFPDGVSCPNRPDWLRALGSLYFGQAGRLLTGPGLAGALLDTGDYGLVAGEPGFVEAVLGTDLAGAAERFRAYARGDSSVPPRTDLTAVLNRYLGTERA